MDSSVTFLHEDAEFLLKILKEEEIFPSLQETLHICLELQKSQVSFNSTVEFFRELLTWSMSSLPEEERIHEALERAIEFPHYY